MSTTEELLFLIAASRQQHGRPNDKQWDELAAIVKEHHAQQFFPFGSTVYTQNDFYGKKPIPCTIQNYTVPFPIGSTVYTSESYYGPKPIPCIIQEYTIGKDYIWVHCKIDGVDSSQTFMPSHLFATPEEAEKWRKDVP